MTETYNKLFRVYMLGGYDYPSKFWDDLQLLQGYEFNKSHKFKRQALYTVFGRYANYLEDFSLDYVFQAYLDGKTSIVDRTKRALILKSEKQKIQGKRDAINMRFNNLFKGGK